MHRMNAQGKRIVEMLSPRELQVLLLLADGLPSTKIAKRFGTAHFTVRNQIQNILRRTGLHSKLAAVVAAYRNGIVHIS